MADSPIIPTAKPGDGDPGYTDEELLQLVAKEMQRSVGFEGDKDLQAEREQALNYYKGRMTDVQSLPNRSKAVSSDVADAIETVLPDLVEIFTGGDDVAAFVPIRPGDEQSAKQETDYTNHVVFQENSGFMTLYTGFKDALLEKVGVFMAWWEPNVETVDEEFTGKTAVEAMLAAKDGEIIDFKQDPPDAGAETTAEQASDTAPENSSQDVQQDQGQPGAAPADPTAQGPTYSFTLRKTKDRSGVRIMTVSPDDFTVAADTLLLKDSTYCAMRARPRAQELLDRGIDADIVELLPPYSVREDGTVEQARDTAGEHTSRDAMAGENDQLRQVEIITHCLRLWNKGTEKLELWRIDTSADATQLIDKKKINRVPFAAITPYPVAHRFYGRSLADLLIEIQKIKTALTRMVLDSGYFALNQRVEVGMDQANDYTISDLLRNEPGVPVRSKNGQAVRPISSGALSFDAFAALEFFATVGEQRTGIVRNAQGLNPNTLHDTATGAMALMSAAQKRVRLIARIFAETGVKDLFLNVHALVRENATSQRIARLNGQWVPVDPTNWAERNDMTIEIGLGASGQAHDFMVAQQLQQMMQAIVEGQGGGAVGPIVLPENVFNLAMYAAKKLGAKTPELFFTDPAQAAATGQQQPPKPDPQLIKVQGELQIAQQKLQADASLESQKVQAKVATDQHLNSLEAQRTAQQAQYDMQLEREKIASAERIAIAVARINAEARITAAQVTANNQTSTGAQTLAFEQANEGTA